MSPFHPTRRDIILVLVTATCFGLLLQFDFFSSTSASLTRAGWSASGAGSIDNRQEGGSNSKDRFLESVETGARYSAMERIAGVGDARVKWENGVSETVVLAHAPGWTIFDQIYLFNGTWFIVTDKPSDIPMLRMMTSTGKEMFNDKASIAGREPTDKDMKIIFPSEARKLWGTTSSRVSGTTFLVNDPIQFLDHYYHFAAELLLGIWRTYATLDPTISSAGTTHLPSPARMILPHVEAGKWNDYAKMNSFISRAVFPSMSYEYMTDFIDRADTARSFLFDRVVFADRAAAFRGKEFPRYWRTSSEAVTLPASRYWWTPIRKNLLDFVGANSIDAMAGLTAGDVLGVAAEEHLEPEEEDIEKLEAAEGLAAEKEEKKLEKINAKLAKSGKPVITYVSRQNWGRRMLLPASHDSLVKALKDLEKKYGWEVNIADMDKMTRDDQIRLAARTTIMMGIHGNGLTHLLWMNAQNFHSTVIEFFFPGGFAEDYEFTARALGIKHFGVWDDTTFTYPDLPQIKYPEGFQGNEIPLNGQAVADLVVERMLLDRPDTPDAKGTGDGGKKARDS